MKLYHYTSFQNFLKIWEDQILRFSQAHRLNDLLEQWKFLPRVQGIEIGEALREQVYKYRQISLTKDFCREKRGCMSTALWGNYGDKNKGVCIEIDRDLLNIQNPIIIEGDVCYVSRRAIPPDAIGVQTERVEEFINKHIHTIFFTKLNEWEYENEYRMICNDDSIKGISIKDAVTGVYVTNLFLDIKDRRKQCYYSVREWLEKLVGDSVPVYEIGFEYPKQGDKYILPPKVKDTKTNRKIFEENIEISKMNLPKLPKIEAELKK